MTIFYTSDHHFSHARIIELAYRPFESVEAMNGALMERWNSVVTEADTVMVLGDICMGKIMDSLTIIRLLNGHKFLLPGNHDRMFDTNPTATARWTAEYEAAGIAVLPWTEMIVDIWEHPTVLCHFPYEGDSHGDDRYEEFRPTNRGHHLIHGHVHGKWRKRGNQINVGVDAWNGFPVSEDQLAVEFAGLGEENLPCIPWTTE